MMLPYLPQQALDLRSVRGVKRGIGALERLNRGALVYRANDPAVGVPAL